MDKTKVDDMLLEMIEPKIQEINKKFSNKGSLTQDDINTLLLKSQYNHINHLDLKLNEVTESVVKLEQKFINLERRFENLEQKFTNLEQKVTSELKTFEQKMEATINDALNKNMTKLIMIMGAFIALFKIIDKF
jgi:predicted  nucleic acid-binding Zn-ribbon protein